MRTIDLECKDNKERTDWLLAFAHLTAYARSLRKCDPRSSASQSRLSRMSPEHIQLEKEIELLASDSDSEDESNLQSMVDWLMPGKHR